jgi:carboxypeptidase family protein
MTGTFLVRAVSCVAYSVALLGIGSVTMSGQAVTAPVIPQPGQVHIPPNTRVIEGTVQDAKGAPVPGAVVLLKDTKTLQIRSYIAQQDGKYHFYGLSTDINYQLRAETKDMTSPSKLVSVFDSHKFIKVDLKLKNKKKPFNA